MFEYVRRYKSTGYKRRGGTVGGFQGFIYHPNIAPPTPPEPTYTLTVVNGHADSYVGHNTNRVSIYADIPEGYVFNRWEINGAGSIDNILQPVAVFQFGEGNCTITATFKKKTKPLKLMYYISPVSLRRRM